MLDAADLNTAKAQLDRAKQSAQAARQAATTADAEAKKAKSAAGDDEDEENAAADRRHADAADEIASGAEGTAGSMELHYEDLKRSEAARTATKRRLIGLVVGLLGSLGLVWTFLFGYGRKIVKNGAGRFFTKDWLSKPRIPRPSSMSMSSPNSKR